MSFEEKIVLVTGAGRGIGRAIAEAFAAQGALVAANDITPVNLDNTIKRITRAGGTARDYVVDVTKKMSFQAMVNQIIDEWERIDILINSARVEPSTPLLDMDAWDWQRTIEVNLSGPFLTTQIVGRVMREQGGGIILNIVWSERLAHDLKYRAAYVASKMGLIGLTREAARELVDFNIRVNAVCPGVIEPESVTESREILAKAAKWLESIPQNRLGQPLEIVGLTMFLCSDEASHISGRAIKIQGKK